MAWTSLVETYASAHLLLAVGSLFAGKFLLNSSTKLGLARMLFVACILSPIVVHAVKPADKPLLANVVSLEGLRKSPRTRLALSEAVKSAENSPSVVLEERPPLDYSWGVLMIVAGLMLFRASYFVRDLVKVRTILATSQVFRRCRHLHIRVSDQCLVPFSVQWLRTSYIVLPVSMLGSPGDMKIALAHEGQHHRQGDCIFAYVMECVSILFAGNPGMARWKNVFTELQEFSCDEALVGHQIVTPHDYGRCLLKVAQIASQGSRSGWRDFACAVGMAQNCGNSEDSILKRRIVMLSRYQSPPPSRMLFRAALASFFVIVPLCTAYAAHGAFGPAGVDAIDTSSLDPRIQKIAEQEIENAVSRYKAKSGAVVIADPKTGRVLAFAERRTDDKLESWATRVFAPASTLKPFIAAAAIDAGVATESQKYDCRGPYDVAGTKFTNHDKSFADMSLTAAVAKSANVCMIKIALDTGSSRLRKALTRFGFDTNSLWRNESSDALQLAKMALGENVPATFATMVKTYSVLANRGRSPSLESVVSESTAEAVQRTMIQVVEQGTGKKAAISGMTVAGKTGTSVDGVNANAEDTQSATHFGLFAGYAPANSPRLVSFVMVEDGHRVDENHEKAGGGAVAAPVFRDVMKRSLEIVGE